MPVGFDAFGTCTNDVCSLLQHLSYAQTTTLDFKVKGLDSAGTSELVWRALGKTFMV